MDPLRLPSRLCLFRLRLWVCDDVRVGTDWQYRVVAVLAGVSFHASPADAANRKRLREESVMRGEDDGIAQHRGAHYVLLPQIRPGITALSLFAFLSGWGE